MCVLYTNLFYSSQRAPCELYANVLLTAGPAGKDSLMVVQMCYMGSREKGQEYFTAILSQDGECCLLNEVDEKSFFCISRTASLRCCMEKVLLLLLF